MSPATVQEAFALETLGSARRSYNLCILLSSQADLEAIAKLVRDYAIPKNITTPMNGFSLATV